MFEFGLKWNTSLRSATVAQTNMAELVSSNFTESLKIAISEVLSKVPPITTIEQDQECALVEFLTSKDIFAVLPTGFGKSLKYQLAELVTKEILPSSKPIFIISQLLVLKKENIK